MQSWLQPHIADWNVEATAPSGSSVELNGVEATSWPNASSIRIVPPRDAFTGRAGTATSLATGRVQWQVSLGSLENGDSARCLSILDDGRGTSWSDVFTPVGIGVQSNEVTVIPDMTKPGPRQVVATEAVVDIVTTGDYSYDLEFYRAKRQLRRLRRIGTLHLRFESAVCSLFDQPGWQRHRLKILPDR
jgi:hypothetical protein